MGASRFFFRPNVQKLKTKRDVQALIGLVRNEKDPYYRATAAKALGTICDATASDVLIEALKDDAYSVRRKAAWALGNIGERAAVLNLVQVLKDGNPVVSVDTKKKSF